MNRWIFRRWDTWWIISCAALCFTAVGYFISVYRHRGVFPASGELSNLRDKTVGVDLGTALLCIFACHICCGISWEVKEGRLTAAHGMRR